MSNGQMIAWVVGIAGGLIGLAGGLFGTYCGIKNTRSPQERALMVRFSIVCWAGVLLFLGLMFTLPPRYAWLLWIPYAILLPAGVVYGSRKQRALREKETHPKA